MIYYSYLPDQMIHPTITTNIIIPVLFGDPN